MLYVNVPTAVAAFVSDPALPMSPVQEDPSAPPPLAVQVLVFAEDQVSV
jgi:hypothetical protein